MKRILAFLSLVVLCCAEASAQTPQPLYPDGKFDGDNGLDSSVTADRDGVRFGVAVPDYFLFRPAPDKANGQCVVVLPGGGYGCVCYQREGIDVARWLNENGVTAVVLRYRMPNGHSEIPLTDVRRMFRTVRENAAEWGIDPCQVGVMGFSAGGASGGLGSDAVRIQLRASRFRDTDLSGDYDAGRILSRGKPR